jgi:hypothetical protein
MDWLNTTRTTPGKCRCSKWRCSTKQRKRRHHESTDKYFGQRESCGWPTISRSRWSARHVRCGATAAPGRPPADRPYRYVLWGCSACIEVGERATCRRPPHSAWSLAAALVGCGPRNNAGRRRVPPLGGGPSVPAGAEGSRASSGCACRRPVER